MTHLYSSLNLLLGIWVALLCWLSLSAPLDFDEILDLAKRDDSLYTIWNSIPVAQKAGGDSALYFKIDQTVDNAWGITYLYGCTALLISDPDFVIVAHMQEITATSTVCINDPAALNNWLATKLQPALDLVDATENTMVELIYNTLNCPWTATGVQSIVTWLTDGGHWDVNPKNIEPRSYRDDSGDGTPTPGQPKGLAVVRWLKPQLPDITIGTLQTYFNSDTAKRDQLFVKPS